MLPLMNKIFKLIILTVLLFLSYNHIYSQQVIKTIDIDGESFINIDVPVLVYFLEQSYEDWESDMKKYGFKILDEQENVAIYYKGTEGKTLQLISKNKMGLVSIDWLYNPNQKSIISELLEFLNPYYVETSGNINYCLYKTWVLGTQRQIEDGYQVERVLIKEQ